MCSYQERADDMLKSANDFEKAVAEWIAENPHSALIYALSTHETNWHGCECDLQTIIDSYNAHKCTTTQIE